MPKEILYFLGGYGFLEPGISKHFLDSFDNGKDSASDNFCRNMASSIFYTGPKLKKMDFTKARISSIDIARTTLIECGICRSKLEDLNVTDSSFRLCDLQGSTLDGCTIRDTLFERSSGELYVNNSDISRVILRDSKMSFTFNHSSMTDINTRGATLIFAGYLELARITSIGSYLEVRLHSGSIVDATFKTCKVEFSSYLLLLRDIKFNNSVVRIQGGARLRNCTFDKGEVHLSCKDNEDRTSIEHSTMADLQIDYSGGKTLFSPNCAGGINSANFRNSQLKLVDGGIVRKSRFINCTVQFHSDIKSNFLILDSYFSKTLIWCRPQCADGRGGIQFKGVSLVGSTVFGLSHSVIDQSFIQCRGFLISWQDLTGGIGDIDVEIVEPGIIRQQELYIIDGTLFDDADFRVGRLVELLGQKLERQFGEYLQTIGCC